MSKVNTNTPFKFKKQFGQNFIFDKNYLLSFLNSLSLPSDSNILEIGAGMGTLSECLASKYRKVVSYEIDRTLIEHLSTIQDNYDNLAFVFKDILKEDIEDIENNFDGHYHMIANLPYYITSEIIFRYLINSRKLSSMTVLVQKEVAERFCAKSGTRDYGVPSVILDTFSTCKILKYVPRTLFTPQPNVDSAFITIDINRDKFKINNIDAFEKFVSNCFKMKRKTLCNNLLKMSFEKDFILSVFSGLSLSPTARPEELNSSEYVSLFLALTK